MINKHKPNKEIRTKTSPTTNPSETQQEREELEQEIKIKTWKKSKMGENCMPTCPNSHLKLLTRQFARIKMRNERQSK